MSAPLMWGQRVRAVGKQLVGQYEGVLVHNEQDLLRVRWQNADGSSGVTYCSPQELEAIPEHPVHLRRRLRAAGIRPPRADRHPPTPACYLKDYGPTACERAYAAWEHGLETDDRETFRSLWDDMQRAHFAELVKRPLRRLRPEIVAQRRASAGDRRWLRTRKMLRAVARAKATGSPA